MHNESLERWRHDHAFGQDRRKSGERRTRIVIAITGAMMVVEIAAGVVYGSMALLADGLHMGSHASALMVSAWAYYFTRRHARDERFNFGTGKVNSLAGFASAVMLVLFALVMAWESVGRLLSPVAIAFNQAILVAVAGLAVNGVCLVILGGHGHAHGGDRAHGETGHSHRGHEGMEAHGHDHGHELGPGPEHPPEHPRAHEHGHDHEHASPAGARQRPDRHKDHNLWAAYLHVMADALTSLLAIFALAAGKYLGLNWLDPVMGLVGAAMVVRWSWGLLRSSARVLLDVQGPPEVRHAIREAIETRNGDRVSDLHVWEVGPGIYAAEIALIASDPKTPEHYAGLVPGDPPIVHLAVEVHRCSDGR